MKTIFLFALILPLVAGDCPVPETADCDPNNPDTAVSCENAQGGPDCCPGFCGPDCPAVVNTCYPEGTPCPELPDCVIQSAPPPKGPPPPKAA